MNAKTKAVVSHLFFVGWVIAIIFNGTNKEEYASYYIRQNLGLILLAIALQIVVAILYTAPGLGRFIATAGGILVFIGWLMSLLWSIKGEMKPVPWVGEMFQSLFKGL